MAQILPLGHPQPFLLSRDLGKGHRQGHLRAHAPGDAGSAGLVSCTQRPEAAIPASYLWGSCASVASTDNAPSTPGTSSEAPESQMDANIWRCEQRVPPACHCAWEPPTFNQGCPPVWCIMGALHRAECPQQSPSLALRFQGPGMAFVWLVFLADALTLLPGGWTDSKVGLSGEEPSGSRS